ASLGIGILRFDFMGLGESAGNFEDTSVSSNISDIVSAYNFLRKNFTPPPSLLIGHSLGGLASLYALEKTPSIKACVTLNAPSSTIHTAKRFAQDKTKVLENGFGELDIMGKIYRVKSTFLKDLEKYFSLQLDFIKIPVMVAHVLNDPIVPYSHGLDIFNQLKSPKSLISLDEMDHLLKNRDHAEQVAHMIYGWTKRYL
nr:alpha/beta fold hydrolase [Pseudomonadota bacterium]